MFSVDAGDVVADGVLEPTVNEHALATAARMQDREQQTTHGWTSDVRVTPVIRAVRPRGSSTAETLSVFSGYRRNTYRRLPAGTSFFGSTNGIAAVVPVSGPFSDSMSSVVPGSASSIGTHT